MSCDYDDFEFERAQETAKAIARQAAIRKGVLEMDDEGFQAVESQPEPKRKQIEWIATEDGSRYGQDPPEP